MKHFMIGKAFNIKVRYLERTEPQPGSRVLRKIFNVRQEAWMLTDNFCPHCGNRPVFCEHNDDGDLNAGPLHICISCDHTFRLPSISRIEANDHGDLSRLQVLKELMTKNHILTYKET